MTYATAEQLALYMSDPPLTACADDDSSGAADAAVVADVLERASGILDGYLQTAGYTVPVTGTAVTAALRHWTCAVAAHLVAKRRPEFRDGQGVAPYRSDWLDAMAWAQKVADGKLQLEGTDTVGGNGPAEADSGGGMVLHAYRDQRRPPKPPRRMRGW